MPKKVYISEKQLDNLLQEYSTPDFIDSDNYHLTWQSAEAYPFIYNLSKNELYVGSVGENHSLLYKDVAAQKAGYHSYGNLLSYKGDEEWDVIEEIFNEYLDILQFDNANIEGRIWLREEIVALWQIDKGLRSIDEIVNALSDYFHKDFRNLKVAINGGLVKLDDVATYTNVIDTTKDEEIKQLHLLNGEEKKQDPHMQQYLKDRCEHIGQKLQYTNKNGEMPLVQYKALKTTSENVEKDKYVIGDEGDGNLGYFHIEEDEDSLTWEDRFDITAKLVEKGYIVHASLNIFDKFDSSRIVGGCRAKEGYGAYFTDMPYKTCEYGGYLYYVKKDIFNFLDPYTAVDKEWLFGEYNALQNELYKSIEWRDNSRNNRDYDYYDNKIRKIKEELSNYNQTAIDLIQYTIRKGNINHYGHLETQIPNPELTIPTLVQLYMANGIDGYGANGIYTIFNIAKLNQHIRRYKMGNIIESVQPTNNIRLYHGTNCDALNDILENGVISAKLGTKSSETKNVNWFSIDPKHRWGTCRLSIDVPEEYFESKMTPHFDWMNEKHVRSFDDININDFNFKIDLINGWDMESLERLLHNSKDDIYIFQQHLMEMFGEKTNVFDFINSPLMLYILQQIKGDDYLRQEGLIENIQYEVAPSDIDLSSFQKADSLNPKLWKDGNTLDSKVRLQLLDIADDFFDTLEIDWVEPIDIVLTGSMCNFNWSEYSDIDLHILLDFDKISNKTDLLRDYFNSKKTEWNDKHDTLTIYGFNVELYVENIKEQAVSSGIYSLEKNKWLKKPNINDVKDIDDSRNDLKELSAKLMTAIDDMYDEFNNTEDNHQLEEIESTLDYMWDFLKSMRRTGLSREGEQSSLNIIYKIIKRNGYIDKICDMRDNIYDKLNSIN